MFLYYYFRIMSVFLFFVPFEVIDLISLVIGNIIFLSKNWRVKSISDNLIRIGIENFDVKEVFINMTRNHLDLLKFYYTDKNYLFQITDCSEVDLEEIQKGKYILVTAHYGNWELAGMLFGFLVKKSVTVAELEGVGEKRYEILKRFRGRTGMKVLPLEETSTGALLEDHIQKGYIPVLLFDRDINKSGSLSEFGKAKVFIPKGPFYFSKKYSRKILLGVFFYEKNKRYRYKIRASEIERDENLRRYSNNGLNALYKVIENKPEEWFAFSMRWE